MITNKEVFIIHEHMLQLVCREAGKLGFDVVIGRSDNDLDRRREFVIMICERSDTYQPKIRQLK